MDQENIFEKIKQHSVKTHTAIKSLENTFDRPTLFFKRCTNEDDAKSTVKEILDDISSMSEEASSLRSCLNKNNTETESLVAKGHEALSGIHKQWEEIQALLEQRGYEFICDDDQTDNAASLPAPPENEAVPAAMLSNGDSPQVDCIENLEALSIEDEEMCVTPYISKSYKSGLFKSQ